MKRNPKANATDSKRNNTMGLILLIILILLLVGAFPTGGYGIGYSSHSIITVLIVVLVILLLLGRI